MPRWWWWHIKSMFNAIRDGVGALPIADPFELVRVGVKSWITLNGAFLLDFYANCSMFWLDTICGAYTPFDARTQLSPARTRYQVDEEKLKKSFGFCSLFIAAIVDCRRWLRWRYGNYLDACFIQIVDESTDSLKSNEIFRPICAREMRRGNDGDADDDHGGGSEENKNRFYLFSVCKVVHLSKNRTFAVVDAINTIYTAPESCARQVISHTSSLREVLFSIFAAFVQFKFKFIFRLFENREWVCVCDMGASEVVWRTTTNYTLPSHTYQNPHAINEVNVSSFCATQRQRQSGNMIETARVWNNNNYEINGLFDLCLVDLLHVDGCLFVEITARVLRARTQTNFD